MIGYDVTVGVCIFAALNLGLTYLALFVFHLRVWHLMGLQFAGVVVAILLIRAAAPGFSQRISDALMKEKETGEFQQDLRVAGFVITATLGLQGIMIHMSRGLTGAALLLPVLDFLLTLFGV
jgi:hypothetical protein